MTAAQPGTLRRVASTQMPTKWGMFDAIGFERDASKGIRRVESALALVMGDLAEWVPLLRIHSQCFTGEVFGSLRCDCRKQLEMAMQSIAKEGRGLVIYEYRQGRGIGLMAKLQAYELRDAGLDTVEASVALRANVPLARQQSQAKCRNREGAGSGLALKGKERRHD